MAGKYTKKEIRRNRIIGISCVVALIVLIVVLSVSCSSKNQGQEYDERFTDVGPNRAVSGTEYLTAQTCQKFSDPLQERGSVTDAYFERSIFIGQSHIGGMRMFYDAIPTADIAYSDSASVDKGIGQTLNFNGRKASMSEILSAKEYEYIYLQFGLNEQGYSARQLFETYYSGLVEEIKSLQPKAYIILMTVLPVSQEVDAKGRITNEGIREYNEIYIRNVCDSCKAFLLDIYELYLNVDDLHINPDVTTNGINLKHTAYDRWRYYVLYHPIPDYLK